MSIKDFVKERVPLLATESASFAHKCISKTLCPGGSTSSRDPVEGGTCQSRHSCVVCVGVLRVGSEQCPGGGRPLRIVPDPIDESYLGSL